MKDLRKSAGIIRALAHQYQAVIDMAEHVGDGVKLEQQTVEAQDRLRGEEEKLSKIKGQIEAAGKSLQELDAELLKRRADAKKAQVTQAEVYSAEEAKLNALRLNIKSHDDTLGNNMRKIDAAQKQLLDLQGTVNEKKEELSRLQDKINQVQAALSKVA